MLKYVSFKELQIFDKVTSWPQLISNLLVAPACLLILLLIGPTLFYTPHVFVCKQIKTHGSESQGQEEAGLRNEPVSYLQVAPLWNLLTL